MRPRAPRSWTSLSRSTNASPGTSPTRCGWNPACSPRPEHAAAISGTTGPANVTMEFANTVRRIHEDPRVSKPYTQPQLDRIAALGEQVDARLAAGDVRLTMGGEPTFVAAADMESAQWRIAADGEEKREYALALARRLK